MHKNATNKTRMCERMQKDMTTSVAGLDYLSEGKEIYYNGNKIRGNDLLLRIFALINEIVIKG